MPLLIVFKDTENNILKVNRAAAAMMQLDPGEIEGHSTTEFYPREADMLFRGDLEVVKSGEPKIGSIESVSNATGEKIWLRVDRIPVRNDLGKVVGVVEIASDFTNQHEVEERLRRSEGYLIHAQEIAHLGSWRWDVINNVLTWSDEMYRVVGLDPADFPEVTHATFIARVHPDDRDLTRRSVQNAIKEKVFTPFEFRTIPINGEIRTVAAHGRVVLNKAGEVSILTGIDQDITERKKTERDLKVTLRKLKRSNDELAEFAYVASHDLKAPLRAIDNISYWLEEDLEEAFGEKLPESSRGHFELLRQRVMRMEKLLTDLLTYSRFERDLSKVEMVDVGTLVGNIVKMGTVPDSMKVEFENLPVFETERVPLKQVFHNLIDNAAKHHDRETGTIRVGVSETEHWYEFSVIDDGPGIPPKHYGRVVRMFQTLKPRDEVEGSGMGLSLIKKIVEQFGGSLTFKAATPRGCAVYFTWPKEINESTFSHSSTS